MEQSEYTVIQNKLILKNGNSVAFVYPILENQVLMIDGIIIVTIETPPKVIYNNNVFAVNVTGEIVWRISFKKEQLFYQKDNCPFTGPLINKEGQLVLCNWCDTAFIVNPQTGEILEKYPTR